MSRIKSFQNFCLALTGAMLIGTLSLPTEVSAQSAGTADVTYSGDVAHILQESCVRATAQARLRPWRFRAMRMLEGGAEESKTPFRTA